jgi:hypothetical protein
MLRTLALLLLFAPPPPAADDGLRLAEGGYGVHCVVPGVGMCLVPASPLGSPCFCPGGLQGIVAP